jgi:hypothetical protein
MDFCFKLATDKDDPDLRHLLATNAMPGRITVTFKREPTYFAGCGTMGRFWQVLVGRHRPSQEIAAVLCRSTQPRFVNGQVREIGYLGQLRVDLKYRSRWVLLHGIQALRELHADGRVGAYLCAISDENSTARGILVGHPRSGFPILHEIAHIHTLGVILRRQWLPAPQKSPASLVLTQGSQSELPRIISFLRQQGAKRQFFPAYDSGDFAKNSPTTRGFQVRDFVIAKQSNEIVGVMGLWDQSTFKQSVVQSYNPSLSRIRPLYNLASRLIGAQPLPAPGQHIRSAYASFVCVADDNPVIFGTLLRHIVRLAARRGYAYLMLGLAESDPLLRVARRYPHIAYYSRLYVTCWEDAAGFHRRLDKRVPYVEIAAL